MSHSRTRLSAVVVSLFALLVSGAAFAAPQRVAVMTMRMAPGTLNPSVQNEVDRAVWQRLATVPGVLMSSEGQIAARLGSAYESYRACAQDSCMQHFGFLAGVDKVVWGHVRRTAAGGYELTLRAVGAQQLGLPSSATAGCSPCTEVTFLGQVMRLAPGTLGLGGEVTVSGAAPVFADPGYLSLRSKPSGAEVFLGPRRLGRTPLKRIELPVGTHDLQLRLADHLPTPVSVVVGPKKHEKRTVELSPTHGFLSIRTRPKGALVAVNGQSVGKTPIPRTKVAVGTYRVGLSLDGHEPVQKEVTVDGKKPAVLSVRMSKVKPTTAVLEVLTVPSGAMVFLNGWVAGNAPVNKELPGGEVEIVATLPGYADAEKTVRVKPGKAKTVKLKLKKAR